MIADRTPSSDRRGVAALTAILLLGLVAAVLAVSAAFFIAENKRTRAEIVDAQLRQLLTAGASVAIDKINGGDTSGEYVVELPEDLNAQNASLKVSLDRDSHRADVTAQYRARTLIQSVRFEQREGKWRIVDAVLGGDQRPASTQPSDRSTAASQRS